MDGRRRGGREILHRVSDNRFLLILTKELVKTIFKYGCKKNLLELNMN